MTDDIRRALNAAQPDEPPPVGFTGDDLVADGRRALRRRRLGIAGGGALGVAALTASAVMLPAAFGGAGDSYRIDPASSVDYSDYDLGGCPTTEDWLADNTGFTGGIDPVRDAGKYEPYDGQWPDGWPGVYPDGWAPAYADSSVADWPAGDQTDATTEAMSQALATSLTEHVPQLDLGGAPQFERVESRRTHGDPGLRAYWAGAEELPSEDDDLAPFVAAESMTFNVQLLLPGNWLPIFDSDEPTHLMDATSFAAYGYTLGSCWSGELTQFVGNDRDGTESSEEFEFAVDTEYQEDVAPSGEFVFGSVRTVAPVDAEVNISEVTVYEVGVVRDDATGVRLHYACVPDLTDCADVSIDQLMALAVDMPSVPRDAEVYDNPEAEPEWGG